MATWSQYNHSITELCEAGMPKPLPLRSPYFDLFEGLSICQHHPHKTPFQSRIILGAMVSYSNTLEGFHECSMVQDTGKFSYLQDRLRYLTVAGNPEATGHACLKSFACTTGRGCRDGVASFPRGISSLFPIASTFRKSRTTIEALVNKETDRFNQHWSRYLAKPTFVWMTELLPRLLLNVPRLFTRLSDLMQFFLSLCRI